MEKVIEIASKVSTPLGLAGLIAAFVFFVFIQILRKNIFPALTKALSASIIVLIIKMLFILALVAMILGFAGFIVSRTWPDNEGRRPAPEQTVYAGKVFAADTGKAIYYAKVSVEEDQKLPQVQYTDSEGIFRLNVSPGVRSLFIHVEADHYKILDRQVSLPRTGLEQIPLQTTEPPPVEVKNKAGRPTQGHPIRPTQEASGHIARARSLYTQRDYLGAIRECDLALQFDPRNQEALRLKRSICVTMKTLGMVAQNATC